jgi:aryl-alcohol dehydrogenase-like predicted oxidoreductase
LAWQDLGIDATEGISGGFKVRGGERRKERHMEYRTLGDSDFSVSAIGFGCWEISGAYGSADMTQFVRAVHAALDLGVTFFDTAPAYGAGHSESALGAALRGRRCEAVISTKVGHGWSDERGWWRNSERSAILAEIDQSLTRLETDYVDYLQIHWPDSTRPFAEAMGALTEIVAAGKARYIGVSNFNAEQLRTCAALAPILGNQVGYNLFDRRWERNVFPMAWELGIGIIAYGPLAHGLLTGALTADTTFERTDWRATYDVFGQHLFSGDNYAQNLQVVAQLKEVAADLGTTLPCMALGWVLRNPQVTSALSGTRRPEEIQENVKALEVRFSPGVLARLDEIMRGAAGLSDTLPA